MNYFTKEHEMFRESLRDFLNKEVKGNIDKWESLTSLKLSILSIVKTFGFSLGIT